MPNPLCSQCGGTGKFFALPKNYDPNSVLDATIGFDCPCSYKEKSDLWVKRIGFGSEYTDKDELWCPELIKGGFYTKNTLIDASATRESSKTFYRMVYGTSKYFWNNHFVNLSGNQKTKPDIMFIPSVDILLRYLLTDEPELDARIFNCDVLIVQLIAAATDKVNHRLRMLYDTKSSGFKGVIWFVRVTTSDFEATCNPETIAMLNNCFTTVTVASLMKKIEVAPKIETPADANQVVKPAPEPKARVSVKSNTFNPDKSQQALTLPPHEVPEEDAFDTSGGSIKTLSSWQNTDRFKSDYQSKSGYKKGRK